MTFPEPVFINLPKFLDERGNLTFLQFPDHLPFEVERTFWIYGIPGGEKRGGHAYKIQQEVIIALTGSFDIIITNQDHTIKKFSLNRSYYGLYIPPLTWRHMENFSTNALSLHISSSTYNREDYIYEFETFKQLRG
jgi:hypothetical protein